MKGALTRSSVAELDPHDIVTVHWPTAAVSLVFCPLRRRGEICDGRNVDDRAVQRAVFLIAHGVELHSHGHSDVQFAGVLARTIASNR